MKCNQKNVETPYRVLYINKVRHIGVYTLGCDMGKSRSIYEGILTTSQKSSVLQHFAYTLKKKFTPPFFCRIFSFDWDK